MPSKSVSVLLARTLLSGKGECVAACFRTSIRSAFSEEHCSSPVAHACCQSVLPSGVLTDRKSIDDALNQTKCPSQQVQAGDGPGSSVYPHTQHSSWQPSQQSADAHSPARFPLQAYGVRWTAATIALGTWSVRGVAQLSGSQVREAAHQRLSLHPCSQLTCVAEANALMQVGLQRSSLHVAACATVKIRIGTRWQCQLDGRRRWT